MQFTSTTWRYAVACGLLALVLTIRFAVPQRIGSAVPYLFYLPVILLAAWWVRLGPALLVLVFGFALDDLLFTKPLYRLHSYGPLELTLVLLYFLSGGIGIIIISKIHRAKEKLGLREAQKQELAREKERFELLSEAAANLLITDEPSTVMGKVFQKLSHHAEVDLYLFFLLDETGEQVRLSSSTGVPREMTQKISSLRIDQLLCSPWMARKEPMVIKDLQCYEDPKAGLLKTLGIRAYTCYPLLPNGKLLGCVAFGSLHKKEFSQEDLDLFRTVCRYISIALDRLRLLKEARERSAQLQAAQEGLQRYAAELEQRVAERTANLAQSLNSLEGVLYHVAHDLRAPLRTIHGFTQLLLEETRPHLDATAEESAQKVKDAARKMDVLIRDLLLYGRGGHRQLKMGWVDLNEAADALLAHFEKQIRAQQAIVQVDRPLPRIWADAQVVQQMVECLLSNALKFVSPGSVPRVRIYAETGPEQILLYVQDNGIGIAPEYQERIFWIFEQLYESEENSGTGIGLAIVRKGMERLGGRVSVQSQVGQGSRFCLEFKGREQSL